MRLTGRCSMFLAVTLLVMCLTTGMSHGAGYEVWQCGECNEFNCQGYDTSATIQFYPFLHKIGDLVRINIDATKVLAINPAAGGGYYCYMMWRVNDAPIVWLALDASGGLSNWDILYETCSYDTDATLQCVDFEDPTPGSYSVGSGITDSGQTMTMTQFQWSNGIWTSAGHGDIVGSGWCDPGGTGQSLVLNNVNVQFDFPLLGSGVVIKFAEHGGNVNLEVNNDFRNASNFSSITGPVGGVSYSCVGAGCTGSGQGILTLGGPISSLKIGGQEFCIDDVCPGAGD